MLKLAIPTAIVILTASGCAALNVGHEPPGPTGIHVEASPLDEWLYFRPGTPEDQQRESEALHARFDQMRMQCMHDAGFQWLPHVYDEQGNSFDDPRQTEYMDNLSDAELEAWWGAYWGPDFEQDEAGNYIWDFDRAGCNGQADYLMEQEQSRLHNEFAQLWEAVDEFYANLLASPEFVAPDSNWSYCMADAGNPNLIRPEIIHTVETATTELEVADLNCQLSTDYENRVRAIIFDAENQFINDHKTELAALRAAAEQGK